MERNYNNNLEIKESEVVEVEKSFDMGKVVDYVLNAIEEYRDNLNNLWMAFEFENEEITLTEEEQEYCKKILSQIEISSSIDYVERLFTAEGFDLFDIEPIKTDNFLLFDNEQIFDLIIKRCDLEWDIKREYALYKHPVANDFLKGFFEWYKSEVDYDSILSNLMDWLECGESISLDSVIAKHMETTIHNTPIGCFTDYDCDSEEYVLWEEIARLIDKDYIENNYWETIYDIRNECVARYR